MAGRPRLYTAASRARLSLPNRPSDRAIHQPGAAATCSGFRAFRGRQAVQSGPGGGPTFLLTAAPLPVAEIAVISPWPPRPAPYRADPSRPIPDPPGFLDPLPDLADVFRFGSSLALAGPIERLPDPLDAARAWLRPDRPCTGQADRNAGDRSEAS